MMARPRSSTAASPASQFVRGRCRTGPTRLLIVVLFVLAAFSLGPPSSHASNHVPVPPGPIDPTNGQQTLLDLVSSIPVNEITRALENFPVPYVVFVSAGGADPVVVNKRAGSPTRIDADRSKKTGQGNSGHDLIVRVDTALLPRPNLLLTVERLGSAPYADDLQIVVAFPFSAFNDEQDEPGGDAPNLFLGYHTTAPFDVASQSYPSGGHAPERVELRLTPGTLAGTNHTFDLDIDTTDADNPVRFLAGHFNAPPGAGEPEDALAMGLLADPVPATIQQTVAVNASAIVPGGATTGSIQLDWEASAPTRTIFDYIENEDFPFDVSDYGTTVTFDQMPTQETLLLDVDFAAQAVSLQHAGNAPVGDVTVHHRRNDGLDIRAVASQVPTEVEAVLAFDGSFALDVSDHTMGLELTAVQDGGFPGSSGLFGYPLGFLYAAGSGLPDLAASWDMPAQSFSVEASNEGDVIGSLAFVASRSGTSIDSDAVQLPLDQSGIGTGVGQPWADSNRHIFSIIDDGATGTAAARLVQVRSGSLDLSTPSVAEISETYQLDLAEPAQPLTVFLQLEPESALLDDAVQLTCNVHDFPHGRTTFELQLPPAKLDVGYETDPPQSIGELLCFGYVGTLAFEVLAGDLPPVFEFEFDPAGSFDIVAEDGTGGSQPVGVIGVRLWDSEGPHGLGAGTTGLLGEILRDARFRGDSIPSSGGTWSTSASSTDIAFDTASSGMVLGGAQIAMSTKAHLSTAMNPPAGQHHYLRFTERGPFESRVLRAGAFGIESFAYHATQGGGSRMLDASYVAAAARPLEVDLRTDFGGPFFPDFAIDARLEVHAVPTQWSLSTDLATFLEHAGSSDVASITLDASIDDTDDGTENPTDISLVAEQLPAQVALAVDPAGTATLHMSGPLGLLGLRLASDESIFGSDYGLIEASLEGVPARWQADWTGGGFSLDARDHTGQPAPLARAVARVSSTSDETTNQQRLALFAHQGIDGCRVSYSPFLRRIDHRYFTAGNAPGVLDRLDAIYCDGPTLGLEPEVEDHLVVRSTSGTASFLSFQLTGFQRLLVEPAPKGGRVEVRVPSPGTHPLFVGFGGGGQFTTVRVEDLPDEIDAELDVDSGFSFEASSSAGTVDLYRGPLPTAGPGTSAVRATVDPLPAALAASWNLDQDDGGVTFAASEPFEVRLLHQGTSRRVVGALQLQSFEASWRAFDFDRSLELDWDCIWPLIPPRPHRVCGATWAQFAAASATFSADPGLSGFLKVYDRIADPQPLHPSGLDPDGPLPEPDAANGEYVPRFSFLLKSFTQLAVDVKIRQCLPTTPVTPGTCFPELADGPPTCSWAPFPPPYCDFAIGLSLDLDVSVDGFVFDFWDRGEKPTVITGEPDYRDNSPWHLWPFPHTNDDHFDPFS